jgi:uncharacterized protein
MKKHWLKSIARMMYAAMALIMTSSCAQDNIGNRGPESVFADARVSALIHALSGHDYAHAQTLVEQGTDVNSLGEGGAMPLIWVLAKHNLPAAEWLLQHGADPNQGDPEGRSPMFYAAGGKYPAYLALLLKNRGNPDLLGELHSPMLAVAIRSETRKENVALLLEHGANVNQPNNDGFSIASEALTYSDYELISVMLDHGLNYKLKELALSVQAVVDLPEAAHWKNVVKQKLEAKGIEMPCVKHLPETCKNPRKAQ